MAEGTPLAARQRWRHVVVSACFALSGLAALVYQVAWTRQFALVLGTSELAVATVLAAYMGGLAIGARTIECLLPRVARPIRLYALLELAIAAAGVALVPACLYLAEQLLVRLLGGQDSPPSSGSADSTLFYLCAAFATLLLPTTLMGATLPLLVRDGVHNDQQIGTRIGTLYACNTGGAVVGALLTALLLLPSLGLRGTVRTAAAVNVLVFTLAWLLQRTGETGVSAAGAANGAGERAFAGTQGRDWWLLVAPGPRWVLPLIFLSGAVAFLHEVLWTRMLQRVVGGSIQAFGVMVAGFLLGIALGGALGARLARDRNRARFAFAFSQLAVALGAIAVWYALDSWALWPTTTFERVGFGLLLLLPLTLPIGVSYPLAVRVLAGNATAASGVSARVYTWNTSGAILGALAGGFWVIPLLRYEGAVQLAVWTSLALALLSTVLLQKPALHRMITMASIVVVMVVLFHPTVPENLLKASIIRSGTGAIVQYYVGRSADVVVIRDDALLDIRTNGLPEAGTPVLGASPAVAVETWMPTLAVMARPDSRDALVVGYGGGNVALAMPPSVRHIDVIELEPKVIEANRAIAAIRARDPLTDTRVNLIYNDARSALALSDKRYDFVVSQPSHPWTAGASHLYTQEFMLQAKRHLNDGGVFVQWMGAEFTDMDLQRSLLATLLSVFHEVRVYRPLPTAILYLASDAPMQPERELARTRAAIDLAPQHYARMGLNAPEDLVVALAMETAGARILAADYRSITDDDNKWAVANVYERKLGMTAGQVSDLFRPFDPLSTADSFVYRSIREDISFEYLWRRSLLWAGGGDWLLDRVRRMTEILGDSEQGTLLRYRMAVRDSTPEVAAGLLAEGLQRWPRSSSLRYAATERALSELTPGAVSVGSPESTAPGNEAATVLFATESALRQKWFVLAALDQQLAQIPATAQWEPQAQRLQAEWRMRVNNRELRQRYGDEGIAIADRAEVNYPDVQWHALRALSAVGTNRPEVIVESTAAFSNAVVAIGHKFDATQRRQAHESAQTLQQVLAQLQGDPRIDQARFAEIRERLDAAASVLE